MFVTDTDAGTSSRSHVPPTASTRRNRSGANRSRASTDALEALMSCPMDDNLAYLLSEGVEADEGPIPGTPKDPLLLVSFKTHVAVAIWIGQILQNPLIIFIYYCY